MKQFINIVLVVFTLLLAFNTTAQRYYGNRYYGHRDYGHRGYYEREYRSGYPGFSVLASLPFGAVMLSIGGMNYHYYDGIYYRPTYSGFMMVEPPVGIIIPSLPRGCVPIVLGRRPYYVYDDTYYSPLGRDNEGYQVVPKPADAGVAVQKKDGATSEYERIEIEGKTYYKKGDAYYKASVNEKGEVKYESVGQLGK